MGLVDRSTTWSDILEAVRSAAGPAVYEDTIPKSTVGPVPPRFDTRPIAGDIRLHIDSGSPTPPSESVLVIETRDFYVVGRRRTLTEIVGLGALLVGLGATGTVGGS